MNYTWNWGVLWQSTGVGDSTYLSWILIGLGWLVVIAIVAWSIAMVLGSILGIMRTLPNKTARAIGTGYVTIFRNVPLLIQLFIWFYVVPNFLPGPIKSWWINDLSAGTTALISASIAFTQHAAINFLNWCCTDNVPLVWIFSFRFFSSK